MISSSILGLTAGSRYSSDLNNNLLKIATNMVPFPRLHFFSVSHYSKPKNSVFDLK
jgi:tubulin beta